VSAGSPPIVRAARPPDRAKCATGQRHRQGETDSNAAFNFEIDERHRSDRIRNPQSCTGHARCNNRQDPYPRVGYEGSHRKRFRHALTAWDDAQPMLRLYQAEGPQFTVGAAFETAFRSPTRFSSGIPPSTAVDFETLRPGLEHTASSIDRRRCNGVSPGPKGRSLPPAIHWGVRPHAIRRVIP
jgi:hypothetical protein